MGTHLDKAAVPATSPKSAKLVCAQNGFPEATQGSPGDNQQAPPEATTWACGPRRVDRALWTWAHGRELVELGCGPGLVVLSQKKPKQAKASRTRSSWLKQIKINQKLSKTSRKCFLNLDRVKINPRKHRDTLLLKKKVTAPMRPEARLRSATRENACCKGSP